MRRENKTKWVVVMLEFAHICIYLVISPLVSMIPLGIPFPFSSNSSTYPENLPAYEYGFDPSRDARILYPNKIDPFGSWSMMAFLLILTVGSLYEWKRGTFDRE
ncbi:hypothetical protein M9H77_18265 [Catharanthus roseus]|uniref:Uncharacterized protein n=1 Tax=Catharanthus roseus TaxID=4058 RepID=A0ACC0B700_CATRO|nr:hypothetical protein M9H77_18265 [Catharanthus roseus]